MCKKHIVLLQNQELLKWWSFGLNVFYFIEITTQSYIHTMFIRIWTEAYCLFSLSPKMILSLVAVTELKKCCITNAYLQWLFHSGEQGMAHGPLVVFFFFFLFFFQSKSIGILLVSPWKCGYSQWRSLTTALLLWIVYCLVCCQSVLLYHLSLWYR